MSVSSQRHSDEAYSEFKIINQGTAVEIVKYKSSNSEPEKTVPAVKRCLHFRKVCQQRQYLRRERRFGVHDNSDKRVCYATAEVFLCDYLEFARKNSSAFSKCRLTVWM